MYSEDTIAAPATAVGDGGVAIIRMSGSLSKSILNSCFVPFSPVKELSSHYLYYGHIHNTNGCVVDEVMAVLMRGPKSFTREDVAEIHCHGGSVVVSQILDLLIEHGARLASPGEFTYRAFLNGRIDLTRAEAIIDLIRSRSEGAARIASSQLQGKLYRTLNQFNNTLLDLLSHVEADIDFPEEDIDPKAFDSITLQVRHLLHDVEHLLSTFNSGRVLREGVSVLIFGRPNVGKSSLLNALLGESRAIVTDVAGTTRDTLEESVLFDGLPLRLIDTAGVRHTEDVVEVEGVNRAKAKIDTADLVLLVVDGHKGITPDDRLALSLTQHVPCLLVVNKSDLPPAPLDHHFHTLPQVKVSVHSGAGIEDLRANIKNLLVDEKALEGPESFLLSDRRHYQSLLRCRDCLNAFLCNASHDLPPELLAVDLREAVSRLGEITGETTPDDVLDRIFSRFCIGK
ncbi:tRNA uridine-5-carboxymethylaminomethyl(34) synthesis GTPase MnmE [Desulfuromonas sp. AOP6]|uniref:tRNA uridine-5-carboxymethylaminomethyl(34) synthesis GTPase MnmE n=1 Tax=Desulfuromonas sp. AOP6 TaxID=1566351 RepID=UPI00126A8CB8|nr:tRNA uridine-5-carboxymethylaminomethyl(34) synthesis GTPase MnmE [Desulfuromonas sp. AOP6]BCA81211.1 tRNA modification GTPase MnmE [Desulfuromonas sp. AOP6]